jgi:hypothetical protein
MTHREMLLENQLRELLKASKWLMGYGNRYEEIIGVSMTTTVPTKEWERVQKTIRESESLLSTPPETEIGVEGEGPFKPCEVHRHPGHDSSMNCCMEGFMVDWPGEGLGLFAGKTKEEADRTCFAMNQAWRLSGQRHPEPQRDAKKDLYELLMIAESFEPWVGAGCTMFEGIDPNEDYKNRLIELRKKYPAATFAKADEGKADEQKPKESPNGSYAMGDL